MNLKRYDHSHGHNDFAQGDIPAVLAVFDTSITWHVLGHSSLSYHKGLMKSLDFPTTMALSGGFRYRGASSPC
jgi:hypothetical protein